MRKVLLAIPQNSTFLRPTMLTFKQLGWEACNIGYRSYNFLSAVKNSLQLPRKAINELSSNTRPSVKRVINNLEVLRFAKNWKPDLFLTFKGEIIQQETIANLRSLGVKTVNWYPDDLVDNDKNRYFINTYDCFVYWDPWKASKFKKSGLDNVLYLPFCSIPEKTPAPKKKKYNINFISTWKANRETVILPIAKYGLDLWGSKSWKKSILRMHYQWGPTSPEEMVEIIRKSKITLNVHVVDWVYSEGTNVRPFETTGAAGFLLTNKREALYELFRVGKEIEVFNDDEELIAKTIFYLKNDFKREKIAMAGWERTKKDHTYEHRYKTLLKYLNLR